jgi:hypothetical protein
MSESFSLAVEEERETEARPGACHTGVADIYQTLAGSEEYEMYAS